MKFINTKLNLKIDIDDGLIYRLIQFGKKHYPKEYGGILVGRYVDSDSMVLIEETVLPKKYKSSQYVFERGAEGLRKSLTKLFRNEPSLIYVGEWHTHPDGQPIPSSTDLEAMKEIVNHAEVFIKNPLLLIIVITNKKFDFKFHVFHNNNIYGYQKEGGS